MVGAWVTPAGPAAAAIRGAPEVSRASGPAAPEAAGGAALSAFTVVSASTGRLLPDGSPAPLPGREPESGKRLPACPEGYVCAYTSLKGYRCDRYGKVTYGVGRRRAGSCCGPEPVLERRSSPGKGVRRVRVTRLTCDDA